MYCTTKKWLGSKKLKFFNIKNLSGANNSGAGRWLADASAATLCAAQSCLICTLHLGAPELAGDLIGSKLGPTGCAKVKILVFPDGADVTTPGLLPGHLLFMVVASLVGE